VLGNSRKSRAYVVRAEERRDRIVRLMWNEWKGFFFDYDYRKRLQGNFWSLAGFYPLWAGFISRTRAKRVADNLKLFEHRGGAAVTRRRYLFEEFKQWDWPNGWANQHWILIKGLLNYGLRNDAERIARKWLELNKNVFLKTGRFWERYDVVRCRVGRTERYAVQPGFGWTNAVFVKLFKEFFE
jgi:alpha,alpha-trehalase